MSKSLWLDASGAAMWALVAGMEAANRAVGRERFGRDYVAAIDTWSDEPCSTLRVAIAVDNFPTRKYLRSSPVMWRETKARTGVPRLMIVIAACAPPAKS